ncbi:MAG: hypothetical protein U0Q16_37325 [Bryobacteraceae bacterium]
MQQLEQLYEHVRAQLPAEPEEHVLLNRDMFPTPPDEVGTAHLKVVPWRLGHIYSDSSRYDLINFFADKDTYRRLGLLFLAVAFRPNHRTVLHLRHPEAEVSKLRIECWAPAADERLQVSPARRWHSAIEPRPSSPTTLCGAKSGGSMARRSNTVGAEVARFRTST